MSKLVGAVLKRDVFSLVVTPEVLLFSILVAFKTGSHKS